MQDKEELDGYKGYDNDDHEEECTKQTSCNSGKYNDGDLELRTQIISMLFGSLDDTEEFYNGYAKAMGFSIRKYNCTFGRNSINLDETTQRLDQVWLQSILQGEV